jgi:3-methyladenine DNA glycosylase/8-oxoguanine DNA glycosylase
VAATTAGERVVVELPAPVDLRRTLAPLGHGPFDPSFRAADGVTWRATRTPAGPATLRIVPRDPVSVEVTAWGPGAAAALAAAPGLVGALDEVAAFDPPPGPLRDAWRRTHALRLTRSGRVLEALVPAVLEQRVETKAAWASWAWLLRRHGEPVPGPAPEGMRVPPSAEAWGDARCGTSTAPGSTRPAPAPSSRPRAWPTGSRRRCGCPARTG